MATACEQPSVSGGSSAAIVRPSRKRWSMLGSINRFDAPHVLMHLMRSSCLATQSCAQCATDNLCRYMSHDNLCRFAQLPVTSQGGSMRERALVSTNKLYLYVAIVTLLVSSATQVTPEIRCSHKICASPVRRVHPGHKVPCLQLEFSVPRADA